MGKRRNDPIAILLRLPKFLLPPPHPCVKERLSRGGAQNDTFLSIFFAGEIHNGSITFLLISFPPFFRISSVCVPFTLYTYQV